MAWLGRERIKNFVQAGLVGLILSLAVIPVKAQDKSGGGKDRSRAGY